MVDLTGRYGGLKLRNPLICASSPNTATPQLCKKAAQAGFSAVVLMAHTKDIPDAFLQRTPACRKVTTSKKEAAATVKGRRLIGRTGGKSPGWADFFKEPLNSAGMNLSNLSDEEYISYANRSKELLEKESSLVIASLVAFSEKGWDELCALIRRTWTDAVELDLGACQVTFEAELFPGLPPGTCPGAVPQVVEQFTRFCCDRLDMPVIVKLPPRSSNPLACALAAQNGGAAGIVWCDGGFFPALLIDPETGDCGLSTDRPSFHLAWGPWMLPYTCGNIANFRRRGIAIDLVGAGGVTEGADIIQLIMSGASGAQVGRAVTRHGYEVASAWLDFILQWLEERKYESIEEIKGIAADKVILDRSRLSLHTPQTAIDGPARPVDAEMTVDVSKCIDCGWCEASCNHFAITMADHFPEFKMKACEVCGICEDVCPVGAISKKLLYPGNEWLI